MIAWIALFASTVLILCVLFGIYSKLYDIFNVLCDIRDEIQKENG